MKQVYHFLTILLLAMAPLTAAAQTAGIWRGSLDVVLNGSSTNYKALTGMGTELNGAFLGNITNAAGSTLTFAAPYLFSFKNGTCDVTGGNLQWRVYKLGNTPGNYNTIAFGFVCNCSTVDPVCGGCWRCGVSSCNSGNNDQEWGSNATVDLKAAAQAADGSAGTYVLDVVWNINTAGSGCVPSPGSVGASATFEATTTLPVALSAFRARRTGRTVELRWQTEMERNNERFEIERSTDGHKWERLLVLASKTPNATTPQSYTATDVAPYPRANHYRLRQIDRDGQSWLSNAVSVDMGYAAQPKVAPNPTSGLLQVSLSQEGPTVWQLLDVSGRIWLSGNTDAQTFQLDLRNFPAGCYFFRGVDENGQSAVQKFFLVRGE